MAQKLLRVALCAALGVAVAVLSAGTSAEANQKAEDKKVIIKEIMKAGHKGADANLAKLVLAVKDAKWEDAQKSAKSLADNGAMLPMGMPKRGEPASWEEKSKKYAENTKALLEAVEKKDAATSKSAIETLQASCKACHDNHKGKGK